MPFTRVAALEELWSGEMTPRLVDGKKVLLVRIGDAVHAYEDRCAHLGVALSEGSLEDGLLTCSAHQWQYDARTGTGINPASACLRRFPVKADEGDVLVDVGHTGAVDRLDRVGPVLEASDAARAVIAAIRDLNDEVIVQDRGSYLRVLVPRRCEVTREAIERVLGHPFRLPADLEPVMPAFKGTFTVTEERAVWALKARP